MAYRVWILAAAALAVGACGKPAFTSVMRSNELPFMSRVESYCRYIADPYDNDELERMGRTVSAAGFRLSFVSHYTSDQTTSWHSIFCWERIRDDGEPDNHVSATSEASSPWRPSSTTIMPRVVKSKEGE